MLSSLPETPSVEFLRKQAKDLHKAHRNGDATCCDVLRNLRQFAGRSDADILADDLKLTEAQYVFALDYGLATFFGSFSARSVFLHIDFV